MSVRGGTVHTIASGALTPRGAHYPGYGSVAISGAVTPRQAFTMGSVSAPTTSIQPQFMQAPMQPQTFLAGANSFRQAPTMPMGLPPPPQAMELAMAAGAAWPQPSVQLERSPPPSTTQHLPDPHQVESQRGAYMKSLDDQLKQGADVLNQQLKQQQDYLLKMGDQQKRQYGLQVDQSIKQQELELVQQHNHQLLMLQQAAQQQKVALEQQANALLIEYNQKKATEDLNNQMWQFESAAQDAHRKYAEEITTLKSQQAMGAQQLAKQGEALVHQSQMSTMQAIAAQNVASRTSASLTCPMPNQLYTPQVTNLTPPSSYLPPVQPGMMTGTMTPRTAMAFGPFPGTIM